MATSPSFFFPTTAPAYAPTTVFPPPPFGFEAPAYGHYPSPFPYTFSSYPTPASGFSPAPAYGSSSFPSAATYHHPFPSPSHSPIPIQIDPNQPPPASPINGDPHLKPHLFPLLHNPTRLPDSQACTPPPQATAPSTPAPPTTGAPAKSSSPAHHTSSDHSILSLHQHHFPPTPDHLPAQAVPQPNAALTVPNRERRPALSNASCTPSDPTPSHSIVEDDAAVLAAADERAQAKDTTRNRQHREFLNLQARLDKQMFAVAMGMETTEAPVTGSSPAITPAQFSSPATTAPMFSGTGVAASSSASSLSSLDASATAYVVPQMFDEMPQRYGLHNLNRHSLVLADGTEHNYFTLPTDYPLERDVPEPVFIVYDDKSDGRPNESVHMFTGIPEQQPFEEEKRESCQAPKCFSKPTFSPERPTVRTVGVFSLTSEQSICDLEKLNDGENLLFEKQDIEQFLSCSSKASKCRICDEAQGDEKKSWDKTVCRTATGHSILFFLWDPGATKFPILFMTAAHATRLQFTYVYSPTINSSEILRHMVTVLSCWLFSFENRDKMQWDPGIANSSYMYSWLKMRAVVRLTWLQRPSVSDLQCQLPMSNTEVGELTSRYLVFHLHQITNLTSPTSSVIRSFENAYSMVCPNGQWEFLHQQGVQKKYTAKNLLSSQSYLQIWEMDIIFITFLPP